ncbi:hypothetical protein WK80_22145 [Burkholderia multivorans]|uniref:hypothetical protein n=1 Tax=Burkholderia multivorans TaxID=87883 RepID=UPI000759DEF8|nr:hypothetical protein [Burkholderia multivorans]KVV22294.1 hypothetical protein WK80_22145 [Burkholderia multivorans]MBU9203145.1 hypothetical protein [Burkholderia multivorans]MCA8385384.1 hypothetical protein [Burkholderia multivorans]
MNQTSPAATGTAGAVIGAIVAALTPINQHLGLNLSAQDLVSIAGGIVVAAHWIAEQYMLRSNQTSTPAQQ